MTLEYIDALEVAEKVLEQRNPPLAVSVEEIEALATRVVELETVLGLLDALNTERQTEAIDPWKFVVTRSRDGYQTIATVPKSECPDHASALRRVWSEFDPKVWRVADAEPNTGSEPK